MLLAIDAGNTNIVFALFEGEKTVSVWRTSTNSQRTSDEYAVFLRTLMEAQGMAPSSVTGAIIGSVVPDANFHLTRLCQNHFQCEPLFVGASNVEIGLKVLLDRPEEIGADRIINAVGGLASYKPPFLIIDFGTATTFDVVDRNGNYLGGAIAPGINLSLQALHMAAAKLPRIGIAPSEKVIGRNTVDAIRSGVYWGYTGLIEGMIHRIKSEYQSKASGTQMTVIATGGLAGLFRETVPAIEYHDVDLTLRGLRILYERNKKR